MVKEEFKNTQMGYTAKHERLSCQLALRPDNWKAPALVDSKDKTSKEIEFCNDPQHIYFFHQSRKGRRYRRS